MTRKFSPLSDDDDNEDDFGNENDTQHQLRTQEDISCIHNASGGKNHAKIFFERILK